jgi:hypothetical protein
MADAIKLSREDVTSLVDKCTDGVLDAAEAAALAEAIRQGEAESQWILDELELAGLISEAFSKTSVEDFVRGFCERLSAEDSGEAFTTETERLLATGTGAPTIPPPRPRLANMLFVPSVAGAARSRSARGRLRPRVRLFALASLTALALAGTLLALAGGSRVASLDSMSANVVLIRDAMQVEAHTGMRLKVGDELQVPGVGSAVVAYDKTTVARVGGYSEAVIASARPRSSDGRRSKQLYLKRGSAVVDAGLAKRGRGLIVATPHATVETGVSRFTVSVTRSSTHLLVEVGHVMLERTLGGKMEPLSQGESIVVGQGEVIPTQSESKETEKGRTR